MVIGFWMFVFAIIFDVIGVGKRQWANRVAAILALGAVVRLLAPSKGGAQLREWANQGADIAGDSVSTYDPQWGHLISSVLVAAVALIVAVIWATRMLPKDTPHGGEAVAQEIDSKWIWGGALVLGLFVSAIPGGLGEIFTFVTGLGVHLGEIGTSKAVTLGHLSAVIL